MSFDQIRREIREKAERKRARERLANLVSPSETEATVDTDVAGKWLTTMSKRHHADAGGTDERMRVVLEGYRLLKELIKEQNGQ